jgi:pimeloyl-ACP methyl ester carboxylesterase
MLSIQGGKIRYVLMLFSLAMWPVIGKFFLHLDSIIDIVHFSVIPIAASFLFLFRPKIQKKNINSFCTFFAIITFAVIFYFIAYRITIPDVRINWLEIPIALYFLMSVFIILWFADKFINFIFTILFKKTLNNKIAFLTARSTLRIGILLFAVTPYLIAIFITHWVKFADCEKPTGLSQYKYSKVEFNAADGITLKGWFIPSQNRVSDSTVIIVPGRSAAKNLFMPYARIFSDSGYNVLLFDLRGNGSSSGHKYSFAVQEVNDVIAAVDYIQKNRTESGNYIFGYGVNEGASALIGAAAIDERFAAVVCDNAGGYDIAMPCWLDKYLPNWLEQNLIKITKTIVSVDIGSEIWGTEGMYTRVSQISPCPVLFSNSIQNNKSNRLKTINLFTNAREPKNLWLPPSSEDKNAYDQYFVNVFQTFITGKSKQQTGNWRISRSY